MNKTIISLVGLVSLVSLPIHAELQVIADLGGESAVRFYEPIQPIIDETSPPPVFRPNSTRRIYYLSYRIS